MEISLLLIFLTSSLIGYIIGSISPGVLLSKKFANIDIREYGSKSSGATNVLRVMGTHMGLVVFVLDLLKAMLACFIGYKLSSLYDPGYAIYTSMAAGLFTVIGHNWPVFHDFKGGKGVACSIAIIVFLFPKAGFISIAICLLIIAVFRYVSLGSIGMLVVFEIILIIEYSSTNPLYCVWGFMLMALCIYRHKENIKRLLAGTENKLGKKVDVPKNK